MAPTAHNSAPQDAFAQTVLMPGDPMRAKYIAETYLERADLVNNVRGVQGYTGFWQGKRVSVMASGMGMPSMGIYSHELFTQYAVQSIIRVGTAGVVRADLRVRDILFAQAACTNGNFAQQFRLPGTFAPIASFALLQKAVAAAEARKITPLVGNVFSSDTFYDDAQSLASWQKMGVLGVEMEAAALYMNAARFGKQALCICTISDNPFTGEACTPQEREQTFTAMMEIALEIA